MIKANKGNIVLDGSNTELEADIISVMSAFIESNKEFGEQFMKNRLLNMVEIACVVHGKNDENFTEVDEKELMQVIFDLITRN